MGLQSVRGMALITNTTAGGDCPYITGLRSIFITLFNTHKVGSVLTDILKLIATSSI